MLEGVCIVLMKRDLELLEGESGWKGLLRGSIGGIEGLEGR